MIKTFGYRLGCGFLVGFLVNSSVLAATLTLDQYLTQVKNRNEGIQASQSIVEGLKQTSDETQILLAPTVFGTGILSFDQRPTINPSFMGTRTIYDALTVGVSKLTDFGLHAKLYYNLNYTSVSGANPAFVTEPKFFQASPVIELSQSLWRNAFGRETQMMIYHAKTQSEVQSLNQKLGSKMTVVQAETAYWQLAFARKRVAIAKGNSERAKRLNEWSSKRAATNLGDQSDALQTDALIKLRTLEWQVAVDDEKKAARDFNILRSLSDDNVEETISEINLELIRRLQLPVRMKEREDLLILKAQKNALVATGGLAIERTKPTLEVFGSMALNGRDPDLADAVPESWWIDHPQMSIGLRFNAPLDLSLIRSVRSGYHQIDHGLDLSYKRKTYEQDAEWNDLVAKYNESKARLALFESIESTQKEKLSYERLRQSRGRSTTYQVLMFEQDFATSELSTAKAQFDVLMIVAQMKTFSDGDNA